MREADEHRPVKLFARKSAQALSYRLTGAFASLIHFPLNPDGASSIIADRQAPLT